MASTAHTRGSTPTLGQVTAIATSALVGFMLGGALMVLMPTVAMLIALILLILRAAAANVRAVASTIPSPFVVGFGLAIAIYWSLALAS